MDVKRALYQSGDMSTNAGTMRVRTETYKGRKLKVKKGKEWGTLEAWVGGGFAMGATGSTPESMDRLMDTLRLTVDFADRKELVCPGSYDAHWFNGRPIPTEEERAAAEEWRQAQEEFRSALA